jgi:peptidoglycan/xylan/chitin deacetylase (PgdA/CDA1 family)
VAGGHEIAGHGFRWIDYQDMPEQVERDHLRQAIAAQIRLTGSRPLGWYTGRTSPNTRKLVIEEGGFLYDADSYADELPYWDYSSSRAHLIVPYTMDVNDRRFAMSQGFNNSDQFFVYMKDTFDTLYAEGSKMMSVGLHCRLAGRPGRVAAIARFIDYVKSHTQVWICTRLDIAKHWHSHHPPRR